MSARSTTTRAASRAASGRPAPSSFDTRVLHAQHHHPDTEDNHQIRKELSACLVFGLDLMAAPSPSGAMNANELVFKLQESQKWAWDRAQQGKSCRQL